MTGPDLTHLEEERDFLLGSLEDLERERAAGDVDDADYAALKDDYTVRAARVLRALEAGAAAPSSTGTRRSPRRLALTVTGVVLVAVLAGVLVAQSAGRRDPGDTATGDIRQSVTEKLNEAQRLAFEQEYEDAVALYDEILATDPNNVEALTYRGWSLHLLGDDSEAVPSLVDAATIDPTYPDAHALLAVVFAQLGLYEQAATALARLDRTDPPPDLLEQIEPVRTAVAQFLATTTTTAAPAP